MPINIAELRRRKWPLPPFPIGQEIERKLSTSETNSDALPDDNGVLYLPRAGYRYKPVPTPPDYRHSSYIESGAVNALALPESIPMGSCGIRSLVRHGKTIYGVTAGKACHLFKHVENSSSVIDCGIVQYDCDAAVLTSTSDGSIFVGTKSVSGGCLRRYPPHGSMFDDLHVFEHGEGIAALISNSVDNLIYGITSHQGDLFALDPKTGIRAGIGRIDSDGIFSPILVTVPDGGVFGAARWGRLFRYDPMTGRIVDLHLAAPALKGREMYNEVNCLVTDKTGTSLYGGTSADGILFQVDVRESRIISLGKPLNQPGIRCLAWGTDDCLYGIAGDRCCHLFRFDPRSRDLSDLGIFHVASPRYWYGYEFDAAVEGSDGKIYFGENDTISHLFSYTIGC